jgi:hypothetical protein
MTIIRIIQWVARIAGVIALLLGLSHWIAELNIINIHMLFGIIVALDMLVLGLLLLATARMRLLGLFSIVYAIILPIFGLTQFQLLVGSLHWLIQTAHLLVGIGALVYIQIVGLRYERLKQAQASGSTLSRESLT